MNNLEIRGSMHAQLGLFNEWWSLFSTDVALLIRDTVGTRAGAEEPPCICTHMLQESDVSGFMAALMC